MTYKLISPFIEWKKNQGFPPFTAIEIRILRVLEIIKNKQHWNTKIKSQGTREQWISQLSSCFNSKDIDYAIAELLYHAEKYTGKIVPGPVDRVYVADSYIPEETKLKILAGAEQLEKSALVEKYSHISSEKNTVNLIDPSLYSLIYGFSRSISNKLSPGDVPDWYKVIGCGEPLHYTTLFNKRKHGNWFSNNFIPLEERYKSFDYQWLPSEFQVTNGKAKILSYINNLHPVQHSVMYTAIESVFEQFVPLFNECLTDSCDDNNRPKRIDPDMYYNETIEEYRYRVQDEAQGQCDSQPSRLKDDGLDVYMESENEYTDDDCYDSGFDESDSYGDSFIEAYLEEKIVNEPEKYHFSPNKTPANNTRVDLSNSRLQVVVKMTNITLTPENPKYEGQSWQITGMQNENIVATGVYFWNHKNVTTPLLSFRAGVSEPACEEEGTKWADVLYNLHQGDHLNQYLGQVHGILDRCVVYPNAYQHRFEPFELKDKNLPGYSKMLWFFLVNPSDRIYSTANIPPQQKDWYEMEINIQASKLWNLPEEISNGIFDKIKCPMDMRRARNHRDRFCIEMSEFLHKFNEIAFERVASFDF